jgi:hypothetical protein
MLLGAYHILHISRIRVKESLEVYRGSFVNAVMDRLVIPYNLMQVLRMTVILKRKLIVLEEIKNAVILSHLTFFQW